VEWRSGGVSSEQEVGNLCFQGKFGLVELGIEWGSRFGLGGVVFYGFGSFDGSVLLFFYFLFLFADFFDQFSFMRS